MNTIEKMNKVVRRFNRQFKITKHRIGKKTLIVELRDTTNNIVFKGVLSAPHGFYETIKTETANKLESLIDKAFPALEEDDKIDLIETICAQ